MSVRAIDSLGDWTFGSGKNNYLTQNSEVRQDIQTRLLSFLGDCFFDLGAGINWFGFLGSKNELGLNLAVSAVILNTANVVSLTQLFITLNSQRQCNIAYAVQSTFSATTGTVIVSI